MMASIFHSSGIIWIRRSKPRKWFGFFSRISNGVRLVNRNFPVLELKDVAFRIPEEEGPIIGAIAGL